jgi:hypothetical protein
MYFHSSRRHENSSWKGVSKCTLTVTWLDDTNIYTVSCVTMFKLLLTAFYIYMLVKQIVVFGMTRDLTLMCSCGIAPTCSSCSSCASYCYKFSAVNTLTLLNTQRFSVITNQPSVSDLLETNFNCFILLCEQYNLSFEPSTKALLRYIVLRRLFSFLS